MHWKLNFDGGSSPNPGRGSCAYKAVHADTGQIISRSWSMKGRNNTNNQAEWEAIITGLEELLEQDKGIVRIDIIGDSQLVIEQMAGRYRVNSKRLKPYYKRWLTLRRTYPEVIFTFKHVYRENNSEMDIACKQAR